MRRLGLLCAVLATLVPPLVAQQRTAFAVLPFESQQSFGLDQESLAALSPGLAQLLASELARSPGGLAVPRSATGKAVSDESLGPRGRVDAATAAKIGRLVGAQYVILGNFVNFYDKFRINVRVVDATTGETIRGLSNDDPKLQGKAQMYRSVQALAQKILKELGLPAAPAGNGSVATDAVIAYSLGLQAEDAGDRAKATGFYEKALAASPGFADAREALGRVRG
jgi:TolB-like protein